MSNLYSKLERDFYFASFSSSTINYDVKATLKNEVGLVQGTRSLSRDVDLKNEKEETGGDSEANVVKMECFLFKPKMKLNRKYEKNKNNSTPESKMKQQSMNLFRGFCFQHGILGPTDLVSGSGDFSFGRQHTNENGGKKGSQIPDGADGPGAERKKSKARSSGGGTSRKKLKPDVTEASGGGGGKRPTKYSSSSEPESLLSIESASENEDPARNLSTDSTVTGSAKPKAQRGKKRRKTKKMEKKEGEHKSKKIKSIHEEETNSGENDTKVSFSILLEETGNEGMKQDLQKHKKSSLSSLKPRKSSKLSLKRNLDKIPHEESSSFSIGRSSNPLAFQKSIQQRDSEWLEWSSTEEDEPNVEEKMEPSAKDKQRPIQQELQAFMNSTKVLDKINIILCLNPYTKVVRSNQCVQVKLVPGSGAYISVCLSAFFFFTTTLTIFSSLITIFGLENPLSSTQKIVKIDFAHHLSEALFLMLLTLFLTIWAVSCILELGTHYAAFYSRFNMGICLLKYDGTDGIHEMIVKHLGCIFTFELLLTFLFFQGYAHTSAFARESCGFLGYTILRPFNLELRESIYYPLVEIFGLGVFLYCFLSVNWVLLHFAVVAKALGNMSKEFNLRMGYAFGTLSVKEEDGSSKYFRKVIPFKKLYAEHQIITSLIRNTSQVHSTVLGAFIFAMIFEIVLSMWLFFDIFLETQSPFLDGVRIYKTANVELAVPLRLQKNEGEKLVNVVAVFAITWLMYWIFGGVLHSAGENCHNGIEFVRRHGLILCKNSKQRRFILSMINSFSPKSPYWIGRKFEFSRAAFVSLMSFVIGASMVTISFRPDRISLTSIELCNENGDCQVIKVYKTAQQVVYATLDVDPPFRPPIPPIGALIPPGASRPPGEIEIYSYNSFLKSPPCASQGTYPLIESVVAGVIHTEWPSPYSQLRLPFLYKMKSVMDPSSSPPKEYILFEIETIYMSSKVDEILKDCYGIPLSNPPAMDDCKNPSFATPKRDDLIVKVVPPPEKQLIAINQIPGYPKSDPRFFCCYKYGISSDNEVKVCNMPSKSAIDSNCILSAKEFPSVSTFIKKLEDKRAVAGTRDDLASDVPYNDLVRTLWTNCLCKRDVSDCNKASELSPLPPRPTPIPGPGTIKPPSGTFKPPPGIIDPIPRPACFSFPNSPDSKKYFIQCKVPVRTGDWKNLQYILYPAIFQQKKSTYTQILNVVNTCTPPPGQPELLSDITESFSPTDDVAIDCGENYFSINWRNQQIYQDDCFNPIIFDSNTRWNVKHPIRVTIQPNDRIVCCVDYQLEDPVQSRTQALVCNNPEQVDTNLCLGKYDQFRTLLTEYYITNFKRYANDLAKQKAFESNVDIVICLCQVNSYVQKYYATIDQSKEDLDSCIYKMNNF